MLQLVKDQVAVWNSDLMDYYYGEDFVYSDRRLDNFVINLFVCHGQFNLVW